MAAPGYPDAVRIPELDLAAFCGVPFPVATVAELRRAGLVAAEGMGKKLALLWNDGRPRAYEDVCPHLGLPLTQGHLDGESLRCRYHGWAFDRATGDVTDQPTLRRPQPCRLREHGALIAGGLVFCWLGDAEEADVRRLLPDDVATDFQLHRVTMEAPFYLALWNAVDYAHFAHHRFYKRAYSLYRRLRRDGHVPGQPFHWQSVEQSDERLRFRLVEAARDLTLHPTAAEFTDDGGINRFQTFVQPLGPRRTVYWEVYSARTANPLLRLAAHAAFRTVIVHLLDTEDRDWTSVSAPNFLAGDNIHFSETDVPLGALLRRFVVPRLAAAEPATVTP